VEQRGCDGVLVETESGDDLRDGHGMLDVGLTRLAALGGMGIGGHAVRPCDEVDLGLSASTLETGNEIGDVVFERLALTPPRQNSMRTHHRGDPEVSAIDCRAIIIPPR
jgi:hypothetical protein